MSINEHAGVSSDNQRSLGRIEGVQIQILAELAYLRGQIAETTINYRKDIERLEEITQLQQKEFERARGAGWVILGIIGLAATFIGGAVLSVFNGFARMQ